jgi:uncharacterized protein
MHFTVTDALSDFFNAHRKGALAFSGGTDSSYLLYAALNNGCDVKAYYVRGAFQPQFEYEDAVTFAEMLKAPLKIIETDIFAFPEIIKNDARRCYYCKQAIFTAVCAAAKQDGYGLVMDGTNATDDAAGRPGMQALSEMQIVSPLRLCGIGKDEVRRRSKEANLATWDKPSYSCLATRIRTGTPITADALERVEKSESFLFSLGFSDFRVRTDGRNAVLELTDRDFFRLAERRQEISGYLSGLFQEVTIDIKAR